MARKAAMHMQFPIKHKTPMCQLSIPNPRKLDINQAAGSGCSPALIPAFAVSDSSDPNTAGPR